MKSSSIVAPKTSNRQVARMDRGHALPLNDHSNEAQPWGKPFYTRCDLSRSISIGSGAVAA
jgi:hypothetical protein